MTALLEVHDLCFSYRDTQVLDGISARFEPGRVVGLVGPNGAGKSTLARCILGLIRPRSGKVLVEDRDIQTMSARSCAKLLAYVPQAASSVFPITVFEACLLGRTPHLTSSVQDCDVAAVRVVLQRLGIEAFAFRQMSELSGGERQIVLLARALAQETPILVLDEPTSALDIRNQLFTLRTISELTRERTLTAIVAIHDLTLAARFCDRILLLDNGRIRGDGTWWETLTPEQIRQTYGIGARVERLSVGPVVVPYEL